MAKRKNGKVGLGTVVLVVVGLGLLFGGGGGDAEDPASSPTQELRVAAGMVEKTPNPSPDQLLELQDPETSPEDVSRAAPTPEPTPRQYTYVLNTSTGKFHSPSCASVGKMKDGNKQEYTGTREAVIAMGYEPCGNCHP
jgi:hypothetical protein